MGGNSSPSVSYGVKSSVMVARGHVRGGGLGRGHGRGRGRDSGGRT